MSSREEDTLADLYNQTSNEREKERREEESILDALKRVSEKPLSRSEKIENCKALAKAIVQPQNKNVAMVFFMTSVAMFTLPVISLILSMQVIAPALVPEEHHDIFNCGVAVSMTVVVTVFYIIYAFRDESLSSSIDYPNGLPAGKKREGKKKTD
eukprot:Tbor_TRINITY_DN5007_c0_g1::TRINITY_DN5007_c0_g1_i1::g.14261::m.14261